MLVPTTPPQGTCTSFCMGNTFIHGPREEKEEGNLFPYVSFRSGCLGPNTLLLSERVCGLQLCYQVSESPLGQGLWEQMLTSARQQENKPQHKRAGRHEIRLLEKGNREKPKLKS